MEVSVFIARIMGPCFIVVAAGMMLNRDFFRKVMEDYCRNAALVFFTGMFPLVFGLVIGIVHNVWVADWPVIITIFGWGGMIKGVWLIVFPDTVPGLMRAYARNRTLLVGHSVVALIFGAALTYFGYFT